MRTTETPIAASGIPDEPDGRSARLWRVRVVRVVLWLMVAAGPLVALFVAVRVRALADAVSAVRGQVAVSVTAPTSAAEGFAEVAVAEFLSRSDGPAEALGPWPILTASLGATEIEPGYFSVTVAASDAASGVAYYSVGVVSAGDGWAVTAAPSLVPAPPRLTPPPEVAVSRLDGLRDVAGLEQAVDGFVAALLTGDGDLARYTARRSPLRAVTPAPFHTAEVTAAGSVRWDDGTRLVMAEVEGVDDTGTATALAYSLVMVERDGRWEVAELLGAPPLAQSSEGN